MISGGVTFTYLSGASPQFTLTCISTGGPATTVSWTSDSTTVITEGTETVLNDTVTAQYTHTLTVTTAGEYNCTVANNKPSSASASITLQGKLFNKINRREHYHVCCTNISYSIAIAQYMFLFYFCVVASPPSGVTASQSGPTSIRVEWTPSSDATGYIIYYSTNGGGSSGNMSVSGGDTMTHTLTGLTNGETYTISIAATLHFPSNNVSAQTNVPLGKVYTLLHTF